MKVLIIGSGGREHALAWKIAQSPRVTKLFCAPGNAGIATLADCVPIAVTEIDGLVAYASAGKIDLAVVGPEGPLCDGIVDAFQRQGLRIFGPTQKAAQLEGSKVFTKKLLLKHKIPTAAAAIFENADDARAHLRKIGAPIVVKADGLASGKGVIVASSIAEAEQAIAEIMEQKIFGAAGRQLILEECLRGEELSVMALVDGQSFQLLASAQDHKRALDDDRGPNTGGMGAYSPTPLLDKPLTKQITHIFQQTLTALQVEGVEYCGVLYAGLMITADGPQVLEFNCRFGDPETQVVLPRMDFDLLDALEATIDGKLGRHPLSWKSEAAVCVVLAAGGYPGPYQRDQPIEGLKDITNLDKVYAFHGGTRQNASGRVVTDGGRVLGVTALGRNIEDAAQRAYQGVGRIHFDGMQFRRDIATRAIQK